MSITCITEVSMYLQYWQKSSKENSRSQCEYVHKRTLVHPQTHIYKSILKRKAWNHSRYVGQKNVWGWLNKMKKKRRRERGRDRERRPRGSTHTLFHHQQAKPLPAPIRPDYTPSTGRLPSRNTPVNQTMDPKPSQACRTEHKFTWREKVYCTAHTQFTEFYIIKRGQKMHLVLL